MGLIRAAVNSVTGVLGDQWKEYFSCDAIPADILVIRGRKQGRSSRRRSDDGIISNGSLIAVNEGQCMLITEQGRVVDVCAEPGAYIYDISSEPSIFVGDLDESLSRMAETMLNRFSFGGNTGKDQRVYYVNTRELVGNRYGTPGPVPFRVVDPNIGLDMDISIRCFGEYSYRIVNPLLFYTNVCGNVQESYSREELDSQLKSELMTALQPAFAKLSQMGIRYSALPGHTAELAQALNSVLSEKWENLRGIRIVSLGISSVTASPEDEEMLKELQRNATFRDPSMAAAHLVGAQASAMRSAASNTSTGSAMAFAGLNMASGAGAASAADLYAMAKTTTTVSSEWTCSCGTVNTGKFCSECGKPKPAPTWTCSCGTVNTGKFCSECGKPRP